MATFRPSGKKLIRILTRYSDFPSGHYSNAFQLPPSRPRPSSCGPRDSCQILLQPAYAPAFSPDNTMCWVSFVLRPGRSSKLHSKVSIARSSCNSRTNDLPGRTSRMRQCRGSWPGNRVVPHEPASKGPSSTKLARWIVPVRYVGPELPREVWTDGCLD
jgi:hypothetical protein